MEGFDGWCKGEVNEKINKRCHQVKEFIWYVSNIGALLCIINIKTSILSISKICTIASKKYNTQ